MGKIKAFRGKPTGFKCKHEALYVGDMLSVSGGYLGFVRVVEREDGFWLEDWDKGTPQDCGNSDRKLDRDIDIPYTKVDPNDPYAEPPSPIECSQCMETVVGYWDFESGEVDWTEDCGKNGIETVHRTIDGFGIFPPTEMEDSIPWGICKACTADPSRTSLKRQLHDYFEEKMEQSDFRIVPGHHPVFRSKEEIDKWFSLQEKILSINIPEEYLDQAEDDEE